jgi:hypothetical protein
MASAVLFLWEKVAGKIRELLDDYNSIEDNLKMFYYRGLKEWNNEKGCLKDTCLTAQDSYKIYLDYFRIAY